MIMRLIIFDKFVQDQEKIKFARMTHTYLETDLIAMRQKKLTRVNNLLDRNIVQYIIICVIG
jgi:hypothetical protein